MKTRYLFLSAVLMLLILPSLEAQGGPVKKRLAILPFSGGEAQDGETISVLLSNQRTMLNAFTVQPRNSAIDRIMGEQQYQRQSGLINSDAISEIGKLNTADLVLSGYIAKLSNTNLILISIIDVTEVQQIAGVYQTYKSIEEIRGLLPGLSQRLVESSRKNYQNLPGLAIPSFSVPRNVNANDAMVLAQILATEIVNLGKYAVFPRNNSVDDVLKEHQFQRSGQTSGAVAMGTSRTIEYILASSVMSLGRTNLFGAQILNIEHGDVIVGADREYQDIADGLNKNLMRQIAEELLAGNVGAVSKPTSESKTTQKPTQQAKEPKEPKEPKPVDREVDKNDRLWTIGVSAGTSLATPLIIGTVHGTIAPINNLFLEIGIDAGLFTSFDPDEYYLDNYYSLYPFVHVAGFVPFGDKGGWYVGAGAGLMIVSYDFKYDDANANYSDTIFAVDITTGFNLFNFLDISYTLRTNFEGASNKISVGIVYRFK